jgi:hypothetical protein
MEDITKAEKAAIYYAILERCNDWQEVYKIAIGAERFNALTDKAKQSNASRWKTSHKIQKAREEIEAILMAREKAIKEKAIKEFQGEETEPVKGATKKANTEATDFLNRDEFLKFLNTRANEVTDDKLRNDILKMLSDNMRYKENENEGTAEIQRFYTPQTCENCEIYNKCKGCKVAECNNI